MRYTPRNRFKSLKKSRRLNKIVYKLCERCQKIKFPIGRQRFCGSWRRKKGCSWAVFDENRKKYHKIWYKKFGKEFNQKLGLKRKKNGFYKKVELERVKSGYYHKRYLKRKKNLTNLTLNT